MTSLLVVFTCSGVLLSGLSVPLILRKVGPNPLYGFRVEQTLEDPAGWYAVNAFSARGLLCVGLATSLCAVVLYLVPGVELVAYAAAVGGVTLAGLALWLVLSFRYLAAVAGGEGEAEPPRRS